MKTFNNAIPVPRGQSSGITKITALFVTLFVFFSCLGIYVPKAEAAASVTTGTVGSVTSTTATVTNSTAAGFGANSFNYGVCWSTSANPTTAGSHTTQGPGKPASWNDNITGLLPATTYHVRAYWGTTYGADVSFTTTKAASTTTVATSGTPSSYGTSVTFTATVSGAVGTPTGTVQFKADGSNLGSPVALSSGSASVTTSALSVTTGTAHAITADYVGDTTYNSSTGTLSGGQTVNKATATVTLSGLSQTWDGSAKTATVTVSPLGLSYSITYNGSTTAPSNPGSYSVLATVTDSNYSGSANGTLVITDTTGPGLDLSMLSNGSTSQGVTINLTGKATDVSGIKSVTVNGVAIDTTAGVFNTSWIFNSTGSNAITVVATDNADNQTTVTRNITFDQSAPALSVTAPADGSTTVANFINLAGTIEAGSSVTYTVNGGSPQSASVSGTSFSGTANLVAGANTIEITATDLSSKQVSIKRTVVSDASGLTLQVTTPGADTISHAASTTISGTVADNTFDVAVTITAAGQTYNPAVVNGAFTQAVALTVDNNQPAVANAIKVTATDGTHSSTVTRTVNTIATTLTLSTTVASPRTAGTIVPVKATAAGTAGSYQYQFWVRSGNTWTLKQDYAANSDTLNWDTTGLPVGTYTVIAYAKLAGSPLAYDAVALLTYNITNSTPATGATLTASPTSQIVKGNTVTFTAGGTTGGVAAGPYEYQFWAQPTGGTWSVIRDYDTANTFGWDTTTVAAGGYNVKVYVRNVGSSLTYEAVKSIGYSVLPAAPASAATLTVSPLSSQPVGTLVTFTAGATSTATVQYQFWLQSGGVWTMKQDYTSANGNVWKWDTNGMVAGSYNVKVYARNVGSPLSYEAVKSVGYTLK